MFTVHYERFKLLKLMVSSCNTASCWWRLLLELVCVSPVGFGGKADSQKYADVHADVWVMSNQDPCLWFRNIVFCQYQVTKAG